MKKIIGIGVLLKTPEGTFLFQERDQHAPLHPGRIVAFGGGIEGSESVMECVKREMFEELSLVIGDTKIETIGTFESHNESGVFIEMFLLCDVEFKRLKLQEGRSIVELAKEKALVHSNVTDFTKEVLLTI